MPHALNIRLAALLGFGACLFPLPGARGATDTDNVTVVSSRVSSAYVRAKLPDGSFQPESFAVAKGGLWTGGMSDATIDRLSFMDVASTIAVSLEDRNYIPTRDAKTTKLLIVVYWGRTSTPERSEGSLAMQRLQDTSNSASAAKSNANEQNVAAATDLNSAPSGMACGHFQPELSTGQTGEMIDSDNALTGAMAMVAAENRSRDQVDAQIASLLGYDSWWAETEAQRGTPLDYRRQDLISELEHDRYYVVLMAYDFQKMWKQKKRELLWETRFSIRERGHEFDKQLSSMVRQASVFFGRDSHGLAREEMPEGRVEVGTLTSLGVVAEK